METLHVARMHARYRLPEGASDTRARLDRALREVLEEGLESALARAGVATHEEICIRAAHASVRLRGSGPDSTLVAAWSVAMADSIRRTIQQGGPGVVRYATRNHALADLLAGVAAGDLRRAWAWRQLDLWSLPDPGVPAAGGAEAVRALLANPQATVAALAAAARAGALPGLVAAIPPTAWTDVARAALRAASLDPEPILRALRFPSAVAADGEVDPPAPAPEHGYEVERRAIAMRRALRLARGSAIARALAEIPTIDAQPRRALSLLAALEGDPHELRRGVAYAAALVRLLDAETGRAARLRGSGSDDRYTALAETATLRPAGAVRDGGHAQAEHARTGPGERAEIQRGKEEERPLPELRASAATEWGGLLFLLHAVDELGLPAEIAAAEHFRARSIRWVLHALALRLVHLDARDPAALAFAGLAPDAELPWQGEAPATEEEIRAVELLAIRVAARAYERLRREPPAGDRAALAAVRPCARRRADIGAEPGWMDVMLRLDEVSVDVRRAGLDLDPGWIPWLGIVIRFVYG